jgi:2-polyprenyl-6-methoxyphenol hydroxylase-like FAD-dependent oxidoreductase
MGRTTAGDTDTDVLIAGGGPVGLALAIELAWRGVRCLVVEQLQHKGLQARAKMLNVRAMTNVRRWGLAHEMRQAIPMTADYPTHVVYATRMLGLEITRFENVLFCHAYGDERFPEPSAWLPQARIEQVFRGYIERSAHAQIQTGQRFERFEQDADGVTSTVSGPEGVVHIRSRYLVGADGARSSVRELMGISMQGSPGQETNVNAVIRVPGLTARHKLGPAIIYNLVNADAPAGIGPLEPGDVWFFNCHPPNWDGELGNLDLTDYAKRAIGADLDLSVLTASTWTSRALVASHHRAGRVFLAGDSCHLHPPTGGFGMNLGIGDAVNLGWKIAAVLQGWGGDYLLGSYESERKPVHQHVVAEASANYASIASKLVVDGIEDLTPEGDAIRTAIAAVVQKTKKREFGPIGVVLGECYAASSVIATEEGAPPVRHYMNYVPSTYAGSLAPHYWLEDGSSLYDHFGPGFSLLVRNPAAGECQEFAAAARRQRIPLHIVELSETRAATLYERRLTLVRPDNHVAWRGNELPTSIADLLRYVAGDLPAPTSVKLARQYST